MYNRISPVFAGHVAALDSWPGGGSVRRRYGACGPAPSDSLMTGDLQHLGPPDFDDVFFFPCIFRVAIGNSESQIEKRQVEKCKVLPLQEQQEETPQGKMQRFKSAKNTRHVK